MTIRVEHESRVAVELEDIGEGLCEEYNADDPNDVPLLRFTVLVRGEPDTDSDGEWLPLDDGSYCTQLPASLDDDTQEKAARLILRRVVEQIDSDGSPKRTCEELSWIEPSWVARSTAEEMT